MAERCSWFVALRRRLAREGSAVMPKPIEPKRISGSKLLDVWEHYLGLLSKHARDDEARTAATVLLAKLSAE